MFKIYLGNLLAEWSGYVVPALFGSAILVLWEGIVRAYETPPVILPAPDLLRRRRTGSRVHR